MLGLLDGEPMLNLIKNLLLIRLIEKGLAANLRHATPDNEVVVKTSRYLRLSMVGLVIGLGASLIFELVRVDGCLLGSISAYYYTPVHSFFVGTLIAIGVCLIALRGNTALEDVLLNFAGTFAPFVALVPTDRAPRNCAATLDVTNRNLNIANNVGGLLVVAGAALAVLAGIGIKKQLDPKKSKHPRPSDYVGYGVTLAFFVAALILFWQGRTWFLEFAHPISAVTMFTIIAINILVNGYNLYESRKHPAPGQKKMKEVHHFNRYTIIGTLMVVAALVIFFILRPIWDQWVFGLEASEIGLFAFFWVLQTNELWNEGLRPEVVLPPGPAAPGV